MGWGHTNSTVSGADLKSSYQAAVSSHANYVEYSQQSYQPHQQIRKHLLFVIGSIRNPWFLSEGCECVGLLLEVWDSQCGQIQVRNWGFIIFGSVDDGNQVALRVKLCLIAYQFRAYLCTRCAT
jgi:hypothetical protein